MIPHGDRRDFALSGRLQNQRQAGAHRRPWRNHVVGVFVERDCFYQKYRRSLTRSPQDELLQRAEARQFAFERCQSFDWEVGAIDNLHETEFRTKKRRNQRFERQTSILGKRIGKKCGRKKYGVKQRLLFFSLTFFCLMLYRRSPDRRGSQNWDHRLL
jgi:hypothetical protein